MHKSLKYFLMLLILGLVLTACGGEADSTDEPADDTSTEEVSTDEVDEVEVDEVMEELVCDDALGCVEVAAGDSIRVASALVITGPNESLGLDSQYGVEIALEDRGEILGHALELQAEDDGCSAEGGQTAGQKIVSDPSIVGVVGTSCSGAGVPMSQIVCDAGMAMISPSNTAPVLTGADTRQPCYFRTAHNDTIQGAAMANFVFNDLGLTQAGIIHDGDPYTEGLASSFRTAFEALGGEVVAFEAEAADATNVEPILTSVAASGPEIIYYPVFIPLGSLITKTAQEIDGLDGVVLAAADGVLSPDFLEAAGDAAEGMFMSGPDLNFGNVIYDTFLETYESNYGTEPTAPFHAHAYDATNLLLNAIETVAAQDADGNLLIGRQALIDAIAATSAMDGITGTISCDEFGDCADPQIAVNQVQGGAFEAIWSFNAEGGEQMGEVEVMDELVCEDEAGCVTYGPDEAIRVASALVITGPNESLGLDSQYGVEIAISDRGEIHGHAVELQAEDDGCSAEGGQTAGQKIVSDPTIVGVVGTSCSGAGVPMSQIVCAENMAMISPSNTAPVLTGADTRQSCYFRTAHNDTIQGAAMANFVFGDLGLTQAGIIHDGDPYTEGLASSFRTAFEALGGEVVAFEAEAADATNVEPILTSVAAAGPEIIYYPVFIPLGSLITKTAQEIDGLDGVVLAAADGVLSPDFLEASGDAAEGMYMSGPDLNFGNTIYDTFLETYQSNYGTEPTAPFHAHAYDATNLLLNAVESVAQVGADGSIMIGRQALIDAIAATSAMDGITGTISCDEFGDCADPQIAVNQVQSGAFEAIWAFEGN